MQRDVPAILADTVHSVGVHNGIARILFIRLDADGKAAPALELFMPVSELPSLARAVAPLARPK